MKRPKIKEYKIPVRLTFNGAVYIEATNTAEAIALLNTGMWEADEIHGLQDWEITGPAMENK